MVESTGWAGEKRLRLCLPGPVSQVVACCPDVFSLRHGKEQRDCAADAVHMHYALKTLLPGTKWEATRARRQAEIFSRLYEDGKKHEQSESGSLFL